MIPMKNIFDIHAGGIDLVFPHHENEIAQSCCALGTERMANVWMHNGFLQVEGQKMAKSVGNFVTIHELLETTIFGGRKWPGEVLRLAMLMTNYREPIDFSVRKLEEAENILSRWRNPEYVRVPYSVLVILGSPIFQRNSLQRLVTTSIPRRQSHAFMRLAGRAFGVTAGGESPRRNLSRCL